MAFDISEIWDNILSELEYLWSFEWIGDAGEFFTGFFENIEEFSIIGLVYGIVLVGLVFLFRKQVFVLIHNLPLKILFFIITFVIGYMMGRKIWE